MDVSYLQISDMQFDATRNSKTKFISRATFDIKAISAKNIKLENCLGFRTINHVP